MGFESFGVRLKGGESRMQEAADTILALDHAVRDMDSEWMPSSQCFLVKDGRHAIELELMGPPASISCRFTVCHPPSVDAAFIELVRKLMEKLNMGVKICDDVTPQHVKPFSLDRFDEFTTACLHYIAARRREWKLAFGNQELGATTAEVDQHIISKHYGSRVEKAS